MNVTAVDHQTCALDDLPAGAWVASDTGRAQLAFPESLATVEVLSCIVLNDSVSAHECGYGRKVPDFLRHIAWLVNAGYPVIGERGRWSWAWAEQKNGWFSDIPYLTNGEWQERKRVILLRPLAAAIIARLLGVTA